MCSTHLDGRGGRDERDALDALLDVGVYALPERRLLEAKYPMP